MSMINDEDWRRPATQGQLAAVTIDLVLVIGLVTECLADLEAGRPLNKEAMSRLAEQRESLNRHFESLTGWGK